MPTRILRLAALAAGIAIGLLGAAPGLVRDAYATVNAPNNSVTYTGNGATTVFSTTFAFQLNSDLVVTVAGAPKTLGVDYTVSGAGNATGSVTFGVAPANSASVVITRKVDYLQGTSLKTSRTYDPSTVEKALDKLAMGQQQLQALYTNPPPAVFPANISATAYGAACNGVADDKAALVLANADAVSQGKTLLIDCKLRIASAAGTIAAPLKFEGNGAIDTTSASGSVTLTGSLTAPISQIFYTGAGTLTVAGTASTILSPHWWGAKGDDTNDDGPAIQKASAAITGRGTVTFEGNKIYRLPTTVSVPMGVSFDGNGATLDVTGTNGVVFDYNAGAGVLTFFAPPTVFSDFRVNGDAAKTATTLVQTFRVPYFTMRDVVAFSTNIAKINGGNVLTRFDHVIAYSPIGTVYWFNAGSDSFGPNFTEMTHCWVENAQNANVIGVRIDKGDIRVHNTYFENLPLAVWLNGGQLGLYDNSFNFRQWPARGLLINSVDVPYGATPAASPRVIITGNDWNMGEGTSSANTQVMIETTTSLSIVFTNNVVDDFNSIASVPSTVFKATAPNGAFYGSATGNRFYSHEQASFTELLSIFDPTTVAGGINMQVTDNFFYGSAGPFNGQIDFTKAGATGTLNDMIISSNTFLRTTNFLRLVQGRMSLNNFQTAATVTWSGTAGVFSDNTLNAAVTVTGAIGTPHLSSAFANLGAPPNGTITYCSDCTPTPTCAASGAGAMAEYINGGWKCNGGGVGSERDFNAFSSANLAGAVAISQSKSTNAATLTADSTITTHVVGVGAGNLVVRLCSDGTTCGAGNIYLTCTQSCTAVAGTVTACAVTKAAVAAATTLTWEVGTACATTNPVVNLNAHFTTP